MLCPKCGNQNYDESKFCNTCGTPLSKPRPNKFRAVIRAVTAVILYISLMFTCQSCVIGGYTSSLMVQNGYVELAAAGASDETLIGMVEDILVQVNEQTVLILLIANLLTVLVLCIFFRLRRKKPAEEMYVRYVFPPRLITFALLGAALNVFVSVTLSFIPFSDELVQSFNMQYAPMHTGNLVTEIASVAFAAGITEELLFRGIALKRLAPAVGKIPAILISSLIFGVVHGTPIAILYATALGIFFGFICVSYKSAVPSLVCHVAFNFTSYLLPQEDGATIYILYVASILTAVYCIYRAFVRRPTVYDLVFDKNGDYEFINDDEREIIEKLRGIRTRDHADAGETMELISRWEDIRRKRK